MLKFFHRIRQSLLSENRFSKYLVYAIGEIILVMIGILLALQVNNWNENRKDLILAKRYLSGIKSDLEKDIKLIDSLIILYGKEINIIRNIDGPFHLEKYKGYNYQDWNIESDTTEFKYVFYRGISFRSIKGNYNSLISDGKTGLIKNRKLFEAIQRIYEEHFDRIHSVYETMKPSEDRLHWLYAYQKKHWTYTDLIKAKDEKILLDLAHFAEIKYFYIQQLFDLKNESNKVITLINQEL